MKDNLLIEDIALMRELWELEENAIESIGKKQGIAGLELEGVRTDKEGASGLKSKSKSVPDPSGDLINQFADVVIKGLKSLRSKETKKTTKIKSSYLN
ncbi:hypothetical protein NDU88_003640 [Pleurodeles waltl]|uniref:Uncharacterized protein n=1 Tax=Pleurodeles waltl TaxID=8319 RepID=A0AAV7RDP1_PLEWA|nr:hypothetical protein NDU88_003640 [Pleurodeles waltl]